MKYIATGGTVIVVAAIIAIVVIGICTFLFFRSPSIAPGTSIDSAIAYKLVTDWGNTESKDGQDYMQKQPNGDFYGRVDSLGFQFDNASQTLVVRGDVLQDAALLNEYKDIMQELDRIAREEPARVSGAQFDLVHMPWDTGDEPTLYLRRDYAGTLQSEKDVLDQWRSLRDMSYLWHRTYYGEAIEPIVERRLKGGQ